MFWCFHPVGRSNASQDVSRYLVLTPAARTDLDVFRQFHWQWFIGFGDKKTIPPFSDVCAIHCFHSLDTISCSFLNP